MSKKQLFGYFNLLKAIRQAKQLCCKNQTFLKFDTVEHGFLDHQEKRNIKIKTIWVKNQNGSDMKSS